MILAGMPKQDAVPNITSARKLCEEGNGNCQVRTLALREGAVTAVMTCGTAELWRDTKPNTHDQHQENELNH